jgi:hypothetical protein
MDGETSMMFASIQAEIDKWKGREFKFEGIDQMLAAMALHVDLMGILQPLILAPTDWRQPEDSKAEKVTTITSTSVMLLSLKRELAKWKRGGFGFEPGELRETVDTMLELAQHLVELAMVIDFDVDLSKGKNPMVTGFVKTERGAVQ